MYNKQRELLNRKKSKYLMIRYELCHYRGFITLMLIYEIIRCNYVDADDEIVTLSL